MIDFTGTSAKNLSISPTLRRLNALAPQRLTPEAPSRFFETREPAATTKAITFDG